MSELEGQGEQLFGAPLDLSDADTTSFEAVPGGTYPTEIFSVKMEQTTGQGKTPAGTPQINVQFKVPEDEGFPHENRRFFRRFTIPGADYPDKDKAAKMKGMLVRFLVALGFDEAEVMSGQLSLTSDMLEGKRCNVVVNRRQYPLDSDPPEYVNDVKNVKPFDPSVVGQAEGASLV